MGVNSGNTSEFRTWWKSIPKTWRNFGLESSQIRNSDVFLELTPIKSEIPTCFRNWLRSSPEVRGVSGLMEEFSASENWALTTLVSTFCLYIYVSTFLPLHLCLYVSVSRLLSLRFCLSNSVSTSLSLCLCLYAPVSPSLWLCLYVSVSISVSLSLCSCLYVSVSTSLSLHAYRYVSVSLTTTLLRGLLRWVIEGCDWVVRFRGVIECGEGRGGEGGIEKPFKTLF